MNHYNEWDPFAAKWLRNLVVAGHLPKGTVHSCDFRELSVQPKAHESWHFFAGIGGWPLALRMAGWNAPAWTASLPCQPFSQAGRRKGTDDERHLWPDFRDLVQDVRPPVIFGEQVASPAGRRWLATVRDEMEALGYVFGAADLCAASVGAPHIRQRLFWVAHTVGYRYEGGGVHVQSGGQVETRPSAPGSGEAGGLGHADGDGAGRDCRAGVGAEAASRRGGEDPWGLRNEPGSPGWVTCGDGKARPIEPGLEPLADGLPNRMGRLRAYGNAIVPQVGAEFVRAVMEVLS